MKYIMNSMVPINDHYLLDEVSCFEKAFAICLSTFDTRYPGLFYMLRSFFKCYDVEDAFIPKKFDGIIFDKLFGVTFKTIDLEENIHSRIESYVKKEMPVVVPGNLMELYYSRYYKTSDLSHPFVIKGFDSERRLYYILDDTQLQSNGEKWVDFFLRYDDLESLNRSYIERLNNAYSNRLSLNGKEGFFVFEESKTKTGHAEILNACVDLFLNNGQEAKSKEEALIDELANSLSGDKFDVEKKEAMIREVVNASKYKNVFFTELIENAFSENLISERSKDELNVYKNNLIDAWQKYSYYIAKLACSQNFRHELSRDKKIVDLEKEMKRELKKVLNKKAKGKSPIHSNKYILENQENLIFYNNDKDFTFRFDGNKLFNTWVEDESPKVFMKNSQEIMNDRHGFTIELSVVENMQNANFMSGIVLKTIKNEIYFFGIDSEKRLNIDKAKEFFSLAEEIGEFNMVDLRICMSEKECLFSYRTENSDTYQTLYSMPLESQGLLIGLGCKTFMKPAPFVVRFEIL